MRKMCQNEVILWGNEQKTGIWIDSVKESMAKVRYRIYLIGIGNLCGEAFV